VENTWEGKRYHNVSRVGEGLPRDAKTASREDRKNISRGRSLSELTRRSNEFKAKKKG